MLSSKNTIIHEHFSPIFRRMINDRTKVSFIEIRFLCNSKKHILNFNSFSASSVKIANTVKFPKWPGLFGSIHGPGGGGIKTPGFFSYYSLIFHSNQSNMVSNDRLELYLPVETLKPFLCCILCP